MLTIMHPPTSRLINRSYFLYIHPSNCAISWPPLQQRSKPLVFYSVFCAVGILGCPVQGFYYFLEALGVDLVVFRTGVISEAFSWDFVLRSLYGHLIAGFTKVLLLIFKLLASVSGD